MSLASAQLIGLTLLAIVFLGVISQTAWCKGAFRRLKVTLRLAHRIQATPKRLLHNVELATPTGSVHIDHLLVVPTGLFVIDTLALDGHLSGSPTHGQWTQQHQSTRRAIHNPLHQNFKRLLAVQDLVNSTHTTSFTVDAFKSVIVLTGRAQVPEEIPDNVQLSRGFTRYINGYDVAVFEDAQVHSIADALETYRLDKQHTTRTPAAHSQRIEMKRKNRLD